jgi:hypothetical protein
MTRSLEMTTKTVDGMDILGLFDDRGEEIAQFLGKDALVAAKVILTLKRAGYIDLEQPVSQPVRRLRESRKSRRPS